MSLAAHDPAQIPKALRDAVKPTQMLEQERWWTTPDLN
jgi:hypothetical protein